MNSPSPGAAARAVPRATASCAPDCAKTGIPSDFSSRRVMASRLVLVPEPASTNPSGCQFARSNSVVNHRIRPLSSMGCLTAVRAPAPPSSTMTTVAASSSMRQTAVRSDPMTGPIPRVNASAASANRIGTTWSNPASVNDSSSRAASAAASSLQVMPMACNRWSRLSTRAWVCHTAAMVCSAVSTARTPRPARTVNSSWSSVTPSASWPSTRTHPTLVRVIDMPRTVSKIRTPIVPRPAIPPQREFVRCVWVRARRTGSGQRGRRRLYRG
ncbi:hypothetical protein C1Y40_01394 [Mycobacterium talmoniae]|uniref:Uncharacterized protein n=1 Tax=Mycobacterium talmoniae TaxID=1858794 RepID=A0A2S8BP45_9MYCO|nr:hypothetical protein C1Y40_01394 [Mycobacterium talmoniae]